MAPLKVSSLTELLKVPNTAIPETVLKYLDTNSFLAFRQVSRDWDQVWWDNLRANVPCHERFFRKLMLFAAVEGLVEKAGLLLSKGMDANIELQQMDIPPAEKRTYYACPIHNSSTPLHVASYFGHLGVVVVLLQKGAEVNARAWNKSTPLHWAAYEGQVGIVRLLLENEADANASDNDGRTAFMEACWGGHLPVVRELMEKVGNLDLNGQSDLKYGQTGFMLACKYGHLSVVQELLNTAQCDTEAKDNFGRIGYDMAGQFGKNKSEIVKMIRQHRANRGK